jgi:SAM-dependent methyltransferase
MLDSEKIKASLVRTYNNYAEERSSKSEVEPWKVKERVMFLQAMQNNNSLTMLEIGAGPGQDSLFFKELGFQVVCTDLSPEMVRICKERGLDARVMDYYKMDFPAGTFDAIYAMNCLLHVPKDQIRVVLGEIYRVMKPQGLFYMGVYGGQDSEGIWEKDIYEPKRFFSFFSDEKITELVEEYYHIESFTVVKYQPDGLHYQSMVMRRMG